MTDTTGASPSNARDHFVVITTPSAAPVPYTITGGNGVVVQSGTVSNSAPVNFQIAQNVGNNIVPTVAGATDHHIDIGDLNTVTTEGIVVEADEPVYVNIRQRSNAQGASMTSKGCAALGTDFRVGTMRNTLGVTQSFRNDFFSVMATEDNTTVTIDDIKPGMIFTGRTDTSPITITLDQYESYTVGINHPTYTGTANVNDIDGTRVTSDKAVTLVSGSYLGSPTSTGARDAGFDQPGPTARAGTQYILLIGAAVPTSLLESPQVIATRPNTNIFLNGALTPINPVPLQPGEYLYLDGNFAPNGTMFIETDEPVVVHQTTAGVNSAATPGFSYIPPLTFDVTGTVNNIAQINQIGAATLRVVTTTGSSVSINGGAPLTGALAVAGTPDWVAYIVPNATGDVSVVSTGPVAVSVLNLNNPVGAAGYFSGFPEFKALIEIVSDADCLPGLELTAIDPSGALITSFEWFNADGTPTGVTGAAFTPTMAGGYFVRSFLSPSSPCTVQDSAVFEVTECPESDVKIEKSVTQVPVGSGDVVTFTMVVTNDGPDPAADVNIEDIVPSAYVYVPGSISGGDVNSDASPTGTGLRWLINNLPTNGTVTVTFDATVQAAGDVLNTVNVTSASIDDDLTNNSATAEIVRAVPEIDVLKSLDSLTDNSDGTFTAAFTVTVNNTGNEPFTNVLIKDALSVSPNDFPAGAIGAVTGGDLSPGTYNGTSDVDLVDGSDTIPAGGSRFVTLTVTFTPDNTAPYQNQATVLGEGQNSGIPLTIPSDDPATPAVDDPTVVTPVLVPEVSLVKDFVSTISNPDGSFVTTFTLTIENTGNEALTSVTLTEGISDFPPGATFTTTPVPTSLAIAQIEVITVEVTYTPDSAGPYTNKASIDAVGILSNDPASATDTAPVTPPLAPSIGTVKTLTMLVDNGGGQFTATFDIVTRNDGNEPLAGVTVTDDLSGFPAGATLTGALSTNINLAVGASVTDTVTVDFMLDASSPYTNTANVVGMGAFSTFPVSDESEVPVEPTIIPAIEVVKALGATIDNGDGSFATTFTITTTNTGNEPLSNVTVSDDLSDFPAGASITGGALSSGVSLAIGASVMDTITVTYTPDGAGPFNNVASATSVGDFSNDPASDTAPAVPVTPPLDAAVEIDKTLGGVADNGDGTFTATFTLTATNSGNEPLSGVQIIDSLTAFPTGTVGSSSANPAYDGLAITDALSSPSTLAVGADLVVTITATFTPDGAQPYINNADVTATGSFTNSPESGVSPDVLVEPLLAPSFTLDKAITTLTVNPDGTVLVSFDITATNNGNELLENLQISDPLDNFPGATGITVSSTDLSASYDPLTDALLAGTDSLAIGEMKTVSIEFTFQPDSAGPFENRATGIATGAASSDPAAAASPIIPVTPIFTPSLTVAKTLQTQDDNGDGTFTATFQIVATNAGNEPLTNVTLTEDISDFPAGATITGALATGATLAVGESLTNIVVVTFPGDASSPYTNTASATSTGEYSTNPAPGTDSIDITPPFDAQIEITKDVRAVTVSAGDIVTSEIDIIVMNVGNEPLDNVSVIDDLGALPNNFTAASLATATIQNQDATTNNAYTGQQPNVEMLAPGQSLAIGESKTITLILTYTAIGGQEEYLNQATAMGTGAFGGGEDTEISDNPDTPGLDNDPSCNAPPFEPELDIIKVLDSVVTAPTGEVTATFTLTIDNVGTETVEDIQVTEDLSGFPAGATFTATSSDFAVAIAGNTLLDGSDRLVIETSGTIEVIVTFMPDGPGPFINEASVNGVGAVTEDPDFDESGPVQITPTFTPSLAVVKTLDSVVDDFSGTFTATFTINVENTSDEPVENLQITDLLANFPAGRTFTTSSTDFTLGAAGAPDLLAGTDTLAIGESGAITLVVTFTPLDDSPILNTASASADGTFSMTNAGADDSASTTPPFVSSFELSKDLVSVIDNGDGSFTSTFLMTATNTGNEDIVNLQITDTLSNFPAGFTSVASSTDFDVIANVGALLDGDDVLLARSNGSVTVAVTFTPTSADPIENQATIDGEGIFTGTMVTEPSDNPDTGPDDDPTVTEFELLPSLITTKALVSNLFIGNGQFEAVFNITVENTGNEALANLIVTEDLTGFPAGATVDASALPTAAAPAALAVGADVTYQVTVTYIPDSPLAYENVANVSAAGAASGTPLTGAPTAEVEPALAPSSTLNKVLVGTVDLGGGNFQSTFQLVLSNTGNETLTNVQITESLAGFPAGSTAAASSSDFTVDSNTGALLAPGQTLADGAQGTVTYIVDFTADQNAPYNNQASSTSTGAASGEPGDSVSEDVQVDVPFMPTFTLDKALTSITDLGDGSFIANYDVVATNTGNEPLASFQINEPLTNFPAGSTLTATATVFSVAPSFASGDLLAGTDVLAIGATQSVTVSVTFTPISGDAIENTVTGTAVGGNSGMDADGSSNTPSAQPDFTPALSITKTNTSSSVDPVTGDITATYTIEFTNSGTQPLRDVQVVDDLLQTGGFDPAVMASATVSSNLTAAPTPWNGTTQTNLLAGADTLAVGEMGTIMITLTSPAVSGQTEYLNQAVANGVGDFDDEPTPDTPSDDPTTGPFGDPTALSPAFFLALTLEKDLVSIVDNLDGSFTSTFDLTVTNTSNEPVMDLAIIDDLSGFPASATSNLTALPTAASLAIGESATYQITVTYVPESGDPIVNMATATATGEVSDMEMTSTMANEPVTAPLTSTMTLNKEAVGIVDNSDGTFTATFRLTATNTSNQILNNVQITDDLSAFAPITVTLVSTDLSALYDPVAGTLLDLTDSLAIDESKSVDVVIDFIPQTSDPVANMATADAVGATDSEPATADSPTVDVTPTLNPALSVAKTRAGPVEDLGGGNFRVTFTLDVANIGNEELLNLQVTDTLADFPSSRTFTASSLDFGIASDISSGDLLIGTETLAVGAGGTITVIVEFAADANQPYDNTASGTARGAASGEEVDDDSETVITEPPFIQELALSKSFVRVVDSGNGMFVADFDINFENLSNEPLNLALTDALGTFPAGSIGMIIGSTGVTVNTGYNGTSDIDLLAPASQLAIGATGQVRIAVTYTPDSDAVYANQTDATASGVFSMTPTDGTASAPVTTPLNSIIVLEKDLLSDLDNGDGTFTSTFQLTATNGSNQPLVGLQITEDFSEFNNASVTLASTDLTPAFNATTFTLLAGSDSLTVGEARSLEIAVTYTPDGTGPFENRATITADGEFDGEAATDASAAPVTPALAPSVDLQKTITGIVDEGDGTFTASFDITVMNDGNEPLTNLTITDDVSDFSAVDSTDFTALPSAIALAVGASETYSVSVRFTPDDSRNYINTASVTADGEFTTTPVGDSDTAEADPPLAPSSALSKALVNITDNGNGSFNADYLLTLENTGNEILTNVQVSDDISTSFPAGSTLTVTAISANLTGPGTGANLLSGSDTLPVNGSGTIEITVTFTPDGPDPYLNTATLTADGGASGDPANSTSEDPSGGGPTTTAPEIEPGIDFSKTLDATVSNPDGSFVSTFTIRAENTGNEILDAVQFTENLSDFPANATLQIITINQVTPAYDAVTGTLLTGTDSLPVNAIATVTVAVTYTPDRSGDFTNSVSFDGTGNASGDSVAGSGSAAVTPPFDPQIEISKDTKTIDVATDGSGEITSVICLIVRNVGNEPLVGVQVSDVLNAAPNNFQDVVSATVTSSDFSVASAANIGDYDGAAQANMLSGTDTLAVMEAGVIELTLVFRETTDQTEYLNQATASGAGEFGGGTDSEVSDNPDTPGDDNDPTDNAPDFEPELEITKALDSIVDNGSGSFTANFTLIVSSVGTETVNNVQITEDLSDFPAGATAVALSSDFNVVAQTGPLLDGLASLPVGASGTLTYAVTFDADGEQPYTNQAVVSGVGNSTGNQDSDISDDPNTTDVEDPTVVDPTFIPVLSFAKNRTDLVDNNDGTFTATYALTVFNPGNEPFANLQISDPLSNFPPNSFGELVSTTFTANATAYDGVTQPNLLAGTDIVPINGGGEVVLKVTFTPISSAQIANTATLSGAGDFGGDSFTTMDGDSVQPVLAPSISLVKELVSITDQTDGTFLATFNITVLNNGNEALANVIISDDFSDFPASAVTDISQLATVTDLAVAEMQTVTVTVLFTSERPGDYTNSASVTADGVASGNSVTDTDTAPVTPPLMPSFEVSKTLDSIADQGDGSFIATFTITAENTGNEAINDFTILEDTSGFPNVTAVTGNLPNGITFPVNGTISEVVTVRFTPDSNENYTNTVNATGTSSAGGTPLAEAASDVADPPLAPSSALSKALVNITDNGNGSFDADYLLTLENTGNEILTNVQVSDDISTSFPAGSTLTVTAISANLTGPGTGANLLSGSDTLPVNGSGTIEITVTFTPDGPDPYLNTATLTADGGASGDPANSTSEDPLGGGSTTTAPEIEPGIDFSKTLDSTVSNPDGSFVSTFTIRAENTGNEILDAVQFTEDLSDFPANATLQIITIDQVTPAYDPVTGTLLTGTDSLPVNAIATVTVAVTYTPDRSGDFTNSVSFDGTGNASGDSVAGSGSAAVTPPFDPQIEISKDTKTIDVATDGSGEITSVICLIVRNVGNEPLVGVQVSDVLNAAPNNFQDVVSATVSSADFSVASVSNIGDYDGAAQANMLSGADTLAVGEAGIIELTLVFRETTDQTEYLNQATASGAGEFGGETDSEVSDNPDTPGDDNDPTDNAPDFEPELEITKALDSIVDNGSGSFTANFILVVSSVGTETVNNVQITEDLSGFPAGATAVALSSDFNVVAQTGPLLDGLASLPVGASGTLIYAVTFNADGDQPYTNQAVVSGVGNSTGNQDSDISDDPNTTDIEDPTVVDPTFIPVLSFAKDRTDLVDNNNGTFTATYTLTVFNPGNEPFANLQISDPLSNFPPNSFGELVSTTFTANATAYDGVTQPNLLAGTDIVPINGVGEVVLKVTFTPISTAQIANTATLSGAGDFGGDSFTTMDGDSVQPVLAPSISLVKELVSITDQTDGTFLATFNITVLNNGNEALENVIISDDFSDFPASAVTDVSQLVTVTDLAVAEMQTVAVTVLFTSERPGDYTNSASVTADGVASGNSVSDADTAPVTPPLMPSFEVSKTLDSITDQGDGSFIATFTITAENTGNEAINDFTILEDTSGFPNVTAVTGNLPNGITFPVNGTISEVVTVRFTPDSNEDYTNTVNATGTSSAGGTPVVGSASDEADPPLAPSSALSKALVNITDNGNGSFDADYLLTLENTGNEILTNVQVSDDISTSFPAGSTLAVTAVSSNLTASLSGANLLAGNDALPVNGTGTINITVTFTPDGPDGYLNTASLTANGGASGDPGNSTSQNPGSGGPTPTDPILTPMIDFKKEFDSIESFTDGSFVATFTISAENNGNEILDSVQITEDLSDFPANATLQIITIDQVTPSYDVTTGTLLTGTDSLPVNATASITVAVTFTPDRGGEITNSVGFEGTGNASGDTTTGSGGSTFDVPFDPQVEISKDTKTVNVSTDGSGEITSVICLTIRNDGNEPLVDLQVSDALNVAPNNFQNVVSATVTSNDFTIASAADLGAYDGLTNINMLSGTDTLAVGGVGIIELTLVFRETTGQTEYLNQATATATGEFGGMTDTEVSDNPDTDPGLDPDGNFIDPDLDNDPTSSPVDFEPELEVTKTLTSVVDNGSGSFTANFIITVASMGTETVNNVQIVESLSGFPVGASAVASSTDFNVVATTGNLLDGLTSLPVGASGILNYSVTFDADGTTYTNQATVNGVGNSTESSDFDESDIVDVPLDFIPALDFGKERTNLVDNMDGTFTATYTLTVSNPGNEPIANLQISDPLNSFPAGSFGELVSTTFTANATAYDGVTQPNLLAGTDTVGINGSGEVVLNVTFTPISSDEIGNTATVSGMGSFGDGPFTTTAGDTVQPMLLPSIDLVKNLTSIVDQTDGSFLATFDITVTNNGNEALENIVITDDFSDFPASAVTDISQLANVTNLAVGEMQTVSVTVLFTPERAGDYTNTAAVTADGVASGTSVDDSDTAPASADALLMPMVVVSKTWDRIVHQGDGSFLATFTITAENTGNEAINNFSLVEDTSGFPNVTAVTGNLPSGIIFPVGGIISEVVTVTFTPDSNENYTNTVNATGTTSAGAAPLAEEASVDVDPPLAPSLDIMKEATGIVSNNDGQFTATFTITVLNDGNEVINGVTAVDPLVGFPTGAVLGGDPLPVNQTFIVGQSESYDVSVTFTPDSAGPFTNVATVSGTGGASSDPASDSSGSPTQSTPTFTPMLAFMKEAAPLVDNADGTFDATFTLTLENTGDEPLVNVQIVDSLAAFSQVTDIVITPMAAVANLAFDGVNDSNILDAAFGLPVGASEVVTLAFTFTPDSAGPFVNSASGTGEGQFGGGAINTPPSEAGVTPLLDPQVEISKDVKTVMVDPTNGIVTSTIELVVRNTGNEPVTNVQVMDDLQLAPNDFPATAMASAASSDFSTVLSYDGINQVSMLAGSDTLAPGEAGVIVLTIVYDPADAPNGQARFTNQAIASVEGEFSGGSDSEPSDNPDTPGFDNDPTESLPDFEGELDLTKRLVSISDIGGGQFRADFEILVINSGNEEMKDIVLTDNISSTFPAGSIATASSNDFSTVSTFDGSSTQAIMVDGGTLSVGTTAAVTVSVTFTPDENVPYSNTASASSTGSQSGETDFDISDDPTTTDDPEDPTLVDPEFTSGMQIRKSLVGSVVDEADGTFTATFLIEVQNLSNQPLQNIQITDDLSGFGTQQSVTLISNDLMPAYNAVTGTLLSGQDTLAFAETKSLQVIVRFTPEAGLTYANTAQGGAVGTLDDTPVNADSGPPVIAPPALAPSMVLTKTLTSVVDLGAGQFRASFTFDLLNDGNEAIENVVIGDDLADFPAGSTLTVLNGESLNIGLLGVSESVTRFIEVVFTADENAPYANQATASGTSQAGEDPVEVISDNDPSTPKSNEPTMTLPPFEPVFTIVKTPTMPVEIRDLGDGRFTSSYDIKLENMGNEPLKNIEVLDDLSDFPLGATARVVSFSGIVGNVDYDGTNAIIENGTLGIGAEALVTIEVTFIPDDSDPVANNASGSAKGANSDLPTDAETEMPAMVTPTFSRSVLFTKTHIGDLVEMPIGTFRADFKIDLTNTGTEPLVGLTITDPLTGFPDNAFLTGGELLPDALNLDVGESASYTVSVTFTPDSDRTYTNQAEVGGAGGTSDLPFVALSDDPSTIAPTDPTRVKPVLTPGIMVGKALINTESLGGDLFRATYQLTATNTGNQPLRNIQIIDDLTGFGQGTVLLSSTELSTSYNANTGELLTGTDSLAVGASKGLTLAVTFTRTRTGAYENSATATGDGAFSGGPVEDGTDDPVRYVPENVKSRSYDEFLADNNLSGDNDDRDLYETLFEYATCLDPSSGDNKKAFCLQYNPATGGFDASFLRRAGGLNDVTYTLQGLDALADAPDGWRDLDVPTRVVPAGAGGLDAERITYSGVQTKAEFVRLTVTLNATGEQQHSQVFGHSLLNLDPECQTFSNPFLAKECFSGTVTSQTGSVLTLSSDLPDLVALGGSLYLDVLDGEFEGHRFEIVEFASQGRNLVLVDSDSLNTLDAVPAPTGLMDSLVAIRIHRTLADIAPPEFFQADSDPTVGEDETRALIYQNGALETYFVNDTAPAATWSAMGDASGSDAGDLIIDPCQGIFLHSLSGPVFRFPSVGVVRQWKVACPLDAGYNLIGAVYPIDQTPNGRGMLDMSNGFTGTSNPGTADQLHFWRGDIDPNERNERIREGYDSYFYAKVGPLDQWVIQADSNLVNENDVSLFPMNRAVFYDKIEPQLWIRPLPWNPQTR